MKKLSIWIVKHLLIQLYVLHNSIEIITRILRTTWKIWREIPYQVISVILKGLYLRSWTIKQIRWISVWLTASKMYNQKELGIFQTSKSRLEEVIYFQLLIMIKKGNKKKKCRNKPRKFRKCNMLGKWEKIATIDKIWALCRRWHSITTSIKGLKISDLP